MLGKSKRSVALLAGAAGFNLLLGVAVASGVVPQPNSSTASDGRVLSAAASPPVAVQETAGTGSEAPAAEAAAEAPPETAPPETAPPTTAAPAAITSPKAAAQSATQSEEAPAQTTPSTPASSAPAAPQSAAVPRLNPTSFQVFQAIQQLAVRIPLFKPTEAQARQFGDLVCTAFDQGKSYAEVKSGVLSAVGQVPGLSVSAADADFAIRTAVELFCPGHKSKLP